LFLLFLRTFPVSIQVIHAVLNKCERKEEGKSKTISKQHDMKVYMGRRGKACRILTFDGGQRSVWGSGRLYLRRIGGSQRFRHNDGKTEVQIFCVVTPCSVTLPTSGDIDLNLHCRQNFKAHMMERKFPIPPP